MHVMLDIDRIGKTLTLCKLCKITALDIVVRLEENLTQPRFANWIIFQVEFIETMEGVGMGMHVQGID